MHVSVILAHPKPDSFNHAIAEAAVDALQANLHSVVSHDLYQEDFDPRFSFQDFSEPSPLVRQHCQEIARANGIIVIHPNWWGQPPAILKGWIEKVLQPGVAYRFADGDDGSGVPIGLLKARAALVFNTSNTPPGRETAVFGDPLETIWKNCVFGFCGVHRFDRRVFSTLCTSTLSQRQDWIDETRQLVQKHFPADAPPAPRD